MVSASASVGVGLATSGRLGGARGGADRRGIHQALALATLIAIAVHGLALLGDGYLHPSLADIAVPFHLGYERLATTAGIAAGWALALLAASYYARRLIGQRRWHAIHRFTLVAWVAGLVHALTEGTDAGQAWFLVLMGATAAPSVALAVVRLVRARRPAGTAGKAGPRAGAEGWGRKSLHELRIQRHPTVDDHRRTGDIAGLLGGRPDDRSRDLLRLAHPPERDL